MKYYSYNWSYPFLGCPCRKVLERWSIGEKSHEIWLACGREGVGRVMAGIGRVCQVYIPGFWVMQVE